MSKNSQAAHAARRPNAENPEHHVGFLLKSLQHSLRQSMDEALRKQGIELSFAQFAALFGLYLDPGITGAQLARRALVSAQTMNAVLHRLETEGLVARRPHAESRRADSWRLTASGKTELERARLVGDSVFSQMLSALSAIEVEHFKGYLRRCIVALGTDDRLIALIAGEPRVIAGEPRERA